MRGEPRPPRRRHRIVCALLAEAGLHGGCPDQQRRGAEGKITEGGGLSMLRQRIKEADGKMEVQSIPRFKLMLSLPEQEEAVYESDDR